MNKSLLEKNTNKSKKISKILFISAPRLTLKQLNGHTERSRYYWEVYPPLGLMYLSSAFKQNIKDIETKVLDLHLDSIKRSQKNIKVDWLEMCKEEIDEFNPDLVAISAMFGASFESTQLIGNYINEKYSDIVIVSGGVHITGLTKEKTDDLNFNDFICIKESERHFPQLVNYLNGETHLVNGVIPIKTRFVKNKNDFTKDTDVIDHVDELPIPDFGVVDIKNYYKYGILSAAQTVSYDTPLATMQTVRGCTARCTFCSVRNFNGFGIRTHSPERVLKEMKILYDQYGIRHIDFVDDDFTVSKERVIKICEMLIEKKLNLTWSIGNGVRLGSLDDEILTYMANAGCTYLSLGIESGDGEMLRQMKKPLTLKILEKKAPLLARHPKIYYRANFITGYPGERPDQLQKTFDCAKKYTWDWCLFSLCKPLPDTELYNKLLENNVKDSQVERKKNDEDYSFQETAGVVADDEQKLFQLTYDNNLVVNFKFNKNLYGRNIPRAISDFERVTKIAENHAFAWNCLTIAYSNTKQKDKMSFAREKTKEITKNNKYWASKFKQLEFKPAY